MFLIHFRTLKGHDLLDTHFYVVRLLDSDFLVIVVSLEVSKSAPKKLFMKVTNKMLFFLWRCDPTPVMASSYLRSLDHT
jgi:hypothetical protein